ncbi:unnamed protein product [Chilo suppressalis]|uniref:RING-type E3 ubiquitin transferase n=1 Tax=Chilo suppressalis TaxID=168631 RepID=A0ABN8BAQ4_CHISP|nr:unnamed protein product [Chilo suppressalis]
METVSASAQDDSSGANPSSVKSDDSSPQHESGRGSPPPNCAICLGTCRNKSFTDSCLHQFCFKCLLTWSRVKAECPLCKQNFRSIIHNVRSNHQYEEYMVEQRQTEETIERLDFDNLAASTRRFRYRTTLTLPRHESLAIQQLLLRHYPIMADVFPPPQERVPTGRVPPARRRRRSPLAFRRTVYRHNLWARPLPDFTGRFRDCSPDFYRYNDSQMHRLVPWLNRELHYLLNENIGHISYVIARILELLPRYHINSPEFREALQVYFRDRTEHFLHELYCFASTPYDLTGYDRNVQYTTDTSISTMVNEVISSSESEASVDSDIVMVSSSGPAEPPPGPSRLPAPVYPQNYIPQPAANNNVIPIETISHSDTDDDSSEVMVVGYIKPPQDRTPEVVDLLGSDSDVIVQDTNPPETQAQSSENQDTRLAPLVKLILKRHASEQNADSDSDDNTQRPPPIRRKKRHRSNDTATTTDTCRTTPSPPHSWESASYSESMSTFSSPTTSSLISSTTTESDSFSTSDSSSKKRKTSKKKKYKKKSKEANSTSSEKRRHKKRKSRLPGRDNKQVTKEEKDKNSTRKSNSGKGVKSSKKVPPPPTPTVQTPPPPLSDPQEESAAILDQPSTSSGYRHKSKNRKRRRPSRESKRLKSVVNVMYNKKSSSEISSGNTPPLNASSSIATSSSSSNGVNYTNNVEPIVYNNAEVPSTSHRQVSNSDSEDDLPLNLTIQKTYMSL